MFTFGREHEKKCAIARVRGEKNVLLIGNLIDTIHDLLEHKIEAQQLIPLLDEAFVEGGNGVWELTANWIERLSAENPALLGLWMKFAKHPSYNVRFKAACCLACMPGTLSNELGTLLLADSSQKVRQRVEGNQLP